MKNPALLKLLGVAMLGFVMLMPLFTIKNKIGERQSYYFEAKTAVANGWSESQRLLGPLLVVPYQTTEIRNVWDQPSQRSVDKEVTVRRYLLTMPQTLDSKIELNSEKRALGIFEFPVYRGTIELSGTFDLKALESLSKDPQIHKIGPPYLSIGLGDRRGLIGSPQISWNGQALSVTAHDAPDGQPGLRAGLADLDSSQKAVPFRVSLSLRGMEQLTLIPTAGHFTAQLKSNWPHPKFTGPFLPDRREISSEGFSARWDISALASGVETPLAHCGLGNCTELNQLATGVSLIEPVNLYLQTERAVKYGLLFIGLTFAAFWCVENLLSLRIHPVQYVLVGSALTVFYLLLLSLAEHLGFDWAYLSATLACTTLLALYLHRLWPSLKHEAAFIGFCLLLYTALYVILQSEDYALLMGASLVFGSLTALMLLTRNLDWYGLEKAQRQKTTPATV